MVYIKEKFAWFRLIYLFHQKFDNKAVNLETLALLLISSVTNERTNDEQQINY